MRNNNFLKNFIMAMVALIASLIADAQEIVWSIVWITVSGNALIYFAKNFWLPSTSGKGKFNWRDVSSGLIMAVGTAISSGAASFIIEGSINWPMLGKTVLGVIIGYVAKTLKSDFGSLK